MSIILLIFNGFRVPGSSLDVKITIGTTSSNFCNLQRQDIAQEFREDDFSKELGKI